MHFVPGPWGERALPKMTTLRILACSDLGGRDIGRVAAAIHDLRPDWVLHIGDLLPDSRRIHCQQARLEARREAWRVHRRSFVHIFAKTTLSRGDQEVARDTDPGIGQLPDGLDGRVVFLEHLAVDSGCADWAIGRRESRLELELEDQPHSASAPWIYVSKAPPFGCLDKTKAGEHVGHRPLAFHLEERGWPQALVLCGSVHEGFGCTDRGEGRTLIVNVAGGYAAIDWEPDGSQVLALERV